MKNCPLLIKKCSHCDSDRFYCSDKFRMNAQKKNIDVWLIYRYVKCDNTCNMTLLSRTKPDLIDKKLFHSFSMNDREVAWQYAFSAGVASRNNLQLDYDSVEYEVINTVSLEDILNMSSEIISIQVKCDFDLSLKLSLLIKRCLPLSSTRLKLLFENLIGFFHLSFFFFFLKLKSIFFGCDKRTFAIRTYCDSIYEFHITFRTIRHLDSLPFVYQRF